MGFKDNLKIESRIENQEARSQEPEARSQKTEGCAPGFSTGVIGYSWSKGVV
jgi:hypothetical protein